MTPEVQRGIAQLVSGICWLVFGVLLTVRSLRKHGLVWPLRWHLLSGLAMVALAWAQLVHAAYWLGWLDAELTDWRLIVPLLAQTVLTSWAMVRWVRDPGEPR